MTLAQAVSLRIDELLKQKNLTQYKLSKLSGVSQSSISEMRSMKNQVPNLYLIYEMSQGFGISVSEFFQSDYFSYDNLTD